MKPQLLCAVLLLFSAYAAAARADEFSAIANSPDTYWVPPPAGYAPPPGPYYYGYYGAPPPVYYVPPPPPPPPPVPSFFLHFHFH